MGWLYELRMAYGISINIWENPAIREIVQENNKLLAMDNTMSLDRKGFTFVYLRSSYKSINRDCGRYTVKLPNINGGDYETPKHMIIHEIDDLLPRPYRTCEERQLLYTIKRMTKYPKFIWIKHSYIKHSVDIIC